MMMFTGKGIMPKVFDNAEDVVSFVSATDGAIGYVSGNTRTENVKIISIK